jgi:hypothetical protein
MQDYNIGQDDIKKVERKGEDLLVEFQVPRGTDKGRLEYEFDELITARLEATRNAAFLEAERQHSEKLQEIFLEIVRKSPSISIQAIGQGNGMNDKGDTYNVGQAGAVGKYARSDNNFFQSEQKKTLADAAAEIQQLLKQLEQINPTATEYEQIVYINDETTPSFKRRVIGALQSSGEAAIDEFILENQYLKVAKAAIKGWLQPGS